MSQKLPDERPAGALRPPSPPAPPLPCPACGLLKDGTGRLCAYCHRAARIQLEEDNKL
jgi:hypothetical protein